MLKRRQRPCLLKPWQPLEFVISRDWLQLRHACNTGLNLFRRRRFRFIDWGQCDLTCVQDAAVLLRGMPLDMLADLATVVADSGEFMGSTTFVDCRSRTAVKTKTASALSKYLRSRGGEWRAVGTRGGINVAMRTTVRGMNHALRVRMIVEIARARAIELEGEQLR